MRFIENKFSKSAKNKITATAITLLLTLSIAAAFVPSANALYPTLVTNHFSYIYCSVGGDVVGTGQQLLLVYWTADIPPDVGEIDGLVPSPEHRDSFSGVSFNVTDPDGITTNIPLPLSDPVGGGYYLYTPTKVGIYTVV